MTLDPLPDRSLAIRAICLYAPASAALLLHLTRHARPRVGAAVLLGLLWTLPALLAFQRLNLLAGWWSFHTAGPALRGMPVELYLGWCCLWGAVPALAFPRIPPLAKITVMLLLDLAVMPLCAPVVLLSPTWWIGEGLAIALVLAPAILLQHWTLEARHPGRRGTLQLLIAAGIFLFLFPELVFALRGGAWTQVPLHGWALAVAFQAIAVLALPGVSAVQEFAERGRGTPIPYDPPYHLVTSGIYRYVANPMQLSCTVVLLAWGGLLGSWWLASAGAVSFVYSAGLARWDEAEDLRVRFGQPWLAYRAAVRDWRLRLSPYTADAQAHLYIARSCTVCSELRRWLELRKPTGLTLVDAEQYPDEVLQRIRYVPAAGSFPEEGIRAFARALEHLHLGWALLAIAMRLPGLRWAVQTILDGVGFGESFLPVPVCSTQSRLQPTSVADDADRLRTSLPWPASSSSDPS